jgi:hypothetical protein
MKKTRRQPRRRAQSIKGSQELLNTARHHCQAMQTIIDQLTDTKSNTELRLLSKTLQRLAFHAAPRRLHRAECEGK